MSKYIIRVEENGELPADEKLDSDQERQIETDGFVLLGQQDGEPYVVFIHHITTEQIAKIIAKSHGKTKGVLLSAYALAEGMEKADEINRKYNSPAAAFSDLIMKAMKDRADHQQKAAECAAAE